MMFLFCKFWMCGSAGKGDRKVGSKRLPKLLRCSICITTSTGVRRNPAVLMQIQVWWRSLDVPLCLAYKLSCLWSREGHQGDLQSTRIIGVTWSLWWMSWDKASPIGEKTSWCRVEIFGVLGRGVVKSQDIQVYPRCQKLWSHARI